MSVRKNGLFIQIYRDHDSCGYSLFLPVPLFIGTKGIVELFAKKEIESNRIIQKKA